MVVTCTPPTLETCREEEAGLEEDGRGLCVLGRGLKAEETEEEEETVKVVSVEAEEGRATSVAIDVMGYETTNLETEFGLG